MNHSQKEVAECEECDKRRGECYLTLTDQEGVILDRKWICRPCAKEAGMQPGAVR